MAENSTGDPNTFFVESHFQKMARRPGGIPRHQALENAQMAMDKIKLGFGDWLDNEIEFLTVAINRGKTQTAGDTSWAEAGLIHARQIRDVGTTMGFELVTFITANLCEIFESVIGGAASRFDLIDCHMDALAVAKQEQYRHLKPEELPELSTGLRRILDVANAPTDDTAK